MLCYDNENGFIRSACQRLPPPLTAVEGIGRKKDLPVGQSWWQKLKISWRIWTPRVLSIPKKGIEKLGESFG